MGAGLLKGLSHEDAARFSFLLATPVLLAAGVLKVPDLFGPLGAGIRGQGPREGDFSYFAYIRYGIVTTMTIHTAVPPLTARRLANKVPEVTLAFWVIKILATTVGETAADFLNDNLNFGLTLTSVTMTVALVVVLVFQFRAQRYIPWLYWLTVVLISVVGTLLTDNLTDNAGIPLAVTTPIFGVLLALTFAVWWAVERTLSIHTISTTRREAFYWAAILFTFALGTAAGDLVSERLSLGYAVAALIFAGAIALVTAGHFWLRVGPVLAFWTAYVLTRPLGASLGDLLSQSRQDGGLGLGTVGTTVLFLVTIVVLVGYLTRSRKDQPRPVAEQPRPDTGGRDTGGGDTGGRSSA